MLSISSLRAGLGPSAMGPVDSLEVPLRDADIRDALCKALLAEHEQTASPYFESEPLLLHEVPLDHGYVRADLTVCDGSRLHIYEIKSDCDRLDRLPEQMRIYSTVGTHVTLVVGWRHAAQCLRLVPEWWEVLLAERNTEGQIILIPLRELSENPDVDQKAIASLLSRDEALDLLESQGCADGVKSKPRVQIYERLAALMSPESLRAHVHKYWYHRLNAVEPAWT